ncbi:MAG: hypothetical protein NTV14_10165 [Coprothermobacterota bacterium]|nr:hypothetical protein [Coprothermobacterota bacterium]
MNAEIYYFSGSGNSLAVARDLATKRMGKLISIPCLMKRDRILPDADIIGIVFPGKLEEMVAGTATRLFTETVHRTEAISSGKSSGISSGKRMRSDYSRSALLSCRKKVVCTG